MAIVISADDERVICDRLTNGASLYRVLLERNLSIWQVSLWLRFSPDFRRRYEAAREAGRKLHAR
ncbi:MAG: hypothetical protein ACRDF8_06645 [Chloroflexota bacterium]